ncbi:putative glycosyl hydrolase family 79 C-terminal beta domain containing protein [Lyophyllum shimeji]|uniref:Glycosyl hydrolase family 79 C-terminal beta domain containing protein n=1 Tax=Lyophyllum shimeji TaxID=47721 RepID=A0A9P3UIB6_LYOSH|nr:putative glycosyl hydrolase family 79 C-terminal beta domain containing protein [Lyophyllum shimeji]
MLSFSFSATRLNCVLTLTLGLSAFAAGDPITVSVPSTAPTHNVVQSNFLGISLELSFMDEYFGNDTSTIPSTVMTYLSAIRSRTGNNPLRLRVGGNSMDSSVYVPGQASPMVQMIQTAANANDQAVDYGPVLWDVMKKVADGVGGAEYLIGLSLRDPNNPNVPVIAAAAEKTLGTTLDGYLLGNEPDLYTSHGQRPNIQNYTLDNYIDEFRTVSNHLTDTSAGNLLNLKNIGGPTICCAWNLDAVLNGGYLAAFNSFLKYISLQHYPQNNCFGRYDYEIPYYMQHANVVRLASWQQPGIDIVQSNTSANHPQLIMSEFNSASCGGIPNISDTFAVGSLWTIDYALQMAAAGYSAAYLHTRERGISYNLFAPPEGPNGGPGPWVTNSPYYALIATAEALQSIDGSVVVDLNIGNSMTNKDATTAGYAVYDAKGASVQRFVLFNYANVSSAAATFAIPASAFKSGNKDTVTVKYLSAQDLHEKTNIAWGGQTLAGVGDGNFKDSSASWAVPNKNVDCSNGCSIDVPPTGMAVVFASGVSQVNAVNKANTTQTNAPGNQKSSHSAAVPLSVTNSLLFVCSMLGFVSFTML